MSDSQIAALALGAPLSIAETGADVQAYFEHRKRVETFLSCVAEGRTRGVPVGTLPPEATQMVAKELDMPNSDALKDEWNTMLECCEETCWASKQEPKDSEDNEQGQVGSDEEDWLEHSCGDHEDVRRKMLVKMGVITDPNTPEEDTFVFYNEVLEAEFGVMVQFDVRKTDEAYHVDYGYMKISAHLVTFLHRQKPVPCTQHPGLGPAGAIVLHSLFLDQLPWETLRSNFRNAMQTFYLQTDNESCQNWIHNAILQEDETPFSDWYTKASECHGLDLTDVEYPKLMFFGVACCDIVWDD